MHVSHISIPTATGVTPAVIGCDNFLPAVLLVVKIKCCATAVAMSINEIYWCSRPYIFNSNIPSRRGNNKIAPYRRDKSLFTVSSRPVMKQKVIAGYTRAMGEHICPLLMQEA